MSPARHRRQAACPPVNELIAGLDELGGLLEMDYRPPDGESGFGLANLQTLSSTELLEPLTVARALGFPHNAHLESKVSTRGYRQLAQIKRLPHHLGARLIEHFGSFQALFSASAADLQTVDGVGENRARIIRDGLVRLAESAYTDRLD